MKLRSLFFLGFGMLAAAFIYLATASAIERAPGIYSISVEPTALVLYDFSVSPKVVHVAIRHEHENVLPDRSRAGEALGPIYALSLKTDGQSLNRYHLRC